MNIRIEGDHSNLKEIHLLIYQSDSKQVIDEDYKSTPGVQGEPILIALIGAATPIVIAAIKAWRDDRKHKRDTELAKAKLETEKEKIRLIYDLSKTRLILENGGNKIIEITANELDELDKSLPPHLKDNKG